MKNVKRAFVFVSLFVFSITCCVAKVDDYILREHTGGLVFPKSMTLLPNNALLISHKEGVITLVTGEKTQKQFSLSLPELYSEGQGGVLDILVISGFNESPSVQQSASGQLLISYSKGTAVDNRLAVVSAKFSTSEGISNLKPVFEVSDGKDTPVHYGGKLLSLPEGGYLVTTGDGFDYREQAQVISSQLGKIVGFTLDGQPLPKPAFTEAPYVYSLGHRNPQGLVQWNGNIYQHEHGPDGGDELNLIVKGNNYGWPVATKGRDYSGARISPFTQYKGMQNPLINWTPSIAPSSMAVYQHTAFASLENTLLVTSLKAQQLFAVYETDSGWEATPIIDQLKSRLRDVEVDEQGNIWVLTDGEEAKIFKISAM